jgi:predicted dehydrogenase
MKGYLTHPSAAVVAACDQDEVRAEQFARDYNLPQAFSSYEEMLARADLDIIDIATPTYLHAPMALRAAQAGKHIHCEKPFCRNAGEGMAVCQAVRRADVKLLIGETYVFISSHMKARELIDAGEIGRPLQIRQRHGAWIARPTSKTHGAPRDRSWRVDPVQSGGGDYPWIYDHAVHLFATAEYLMPGQAVSQVYAVTASSPQASVRCGAAHDPYVTSDIDIPIITWKYDDPACQGVWMRAERLNGKYDYMRGFSTTVIGERGALEVLGEGGHNLIWESAQQHLVLHREGRDSLCFRFNEGGDDIWQSDICYYSQGHVNQVHHLIDCILGGAQPRYDGEDGVHAVRCTLATIRSAQESRPVRIDEIEPDYTAYS